MVSSRSTPSLLSQSTTSTVVGPYYDDGDKDYEMALADMMSSYGDSMWSGQVTSIYPPRAPLQHEKRRGIFASIRGRAAPDMVKEEEDGGEEEAADEVDAKKPVRKNKRWSFKPFRRSE